jgi:hypothetical protein
MKTSKDCVYYTISKSIEYDNKVLLWSLCKEQDGTIRYPWYPAYFLHYELFLLWKIINVNWEDWKPVLSREENNS